MTQIRSVLCPVDFTPEADRALELAAAVCKRLDARLIIEHNLKPRPPSYLTISWMWSEEFEGQEQREPAEAERKLQELLRGLTGSVSCEAKLTRGPIDNSLLFLAKELPADLVVMSSHGRSTPEHRSLTERIVEKAPCPVLSAGRTGSSALAAEEGPLRVLVPLELNAADTHTLAYLDYLSGYWPLRLECLHVEPESDPAREEHRGRRALERMRELVPEGLAAETGFHLAFGEIAAAVLQQAGEVEPDLIVMAAHRKRLLRRRPVEIDFELLHGASCPVWFVTPTSGRRRSEATG